MQTLYSINGLFVRHCVQSLRHLCQQSPEVPPIRVFVKNRYQHFVDSLRLTVSAGSGGHGLPKFGGMGGKGGDVYVEAVDEQQTLKDLKYKVKKLKASSGEDSAHYRMLGKDGTDCVIRAPVGLTILSQNGRTLGQLDKIGDKVLVALGGNGGNPYNNYCGVKGQKQAIILDLKLLADAGLVGFPNAGKSTLLKALSRAQPKIANYPFTTINPNIGIMEFDDFRQISIADLPGLIEGAHNNVGLGHKFLKHIVRTKLLMFVIDINGFKYRPEWPKRSALETLLLLNRELELYDDTLVSKPALLVISKLDNNECEEKYNKFLNDFEILKTQGMKSISNECLKSKQLINFDQIIGVCAKNSHNIENLKHIIRNTIDLNYEYNKEKNNEIITFEKIQSNKRKLNSEEEEVVLI